MSLNFEGSNVFFEAIEKTSPYNGSTYGGLILHVASQTTLEEVKQLTQSAFQLVDDWTRGQTLDFIDDINKKSTSSNFWKTHINEITTMCGIFATAIWKNQGLETNTEEFKKLQRLIFFAVLFNFVMTIQNSSRNKAFIEKSIGGGKGMFSRLFGA